MNMLKQIVRWANSTPRWSPTELWESFTLDQGTSVDGNDIYGKKILDTPYGKIVKDLTEEGVKIGASRGMGSLKQVNGVNEVQEDFNLAAVDIVADPSAPDAYVEGIMKEKSGWENVSPLVVLNHIRSTLSVL